MTTIIFLASYLLMFVITYLVFLKFDTDYVGERFDNRRVYFDYLVLSTVWPITWVVTLIFVAFTAIEKKIKDYKQKQEKF